MDDKEAFELIAAHAVPGTEADAGPLSRLRCKLRMAFTDGTFVSTYGLQRRMTEVLEAPEWMQAAEEANALRSQLEHWKTFAIHAEGEHAAWKKTAIELDFELRALRTPAPLMAWITQGGCECLQRGVQAPGARGGVGAIPGAGAGHAAGR